MARIRAKLTKKGIDALQAPPPGTKCYTVTDTEDDGLRLRVFESGKKRFALEYRRGAAVRWYTFGTYGDMTIDQARKEASALRARIAKGFDPADAKARDRVAPTFGEFADRWLERAKTRKKPASIRNDELLLRLYLKPAFGRRKVRDVRRADVEQLRDKLKDKTTTANRVLALASTIFNAAEAQDERDQNTNPCRHVERYRERKVERPLTVDELQALWATLATSNEAPAAVAAIRLLVLTGLRCGEVLALRWNDVDTEGARLHLRDSKTGARRVVLSAEAVELLDSLPRTAEHVFPGGKAGEPLADLTHPWVRIRRAAGLEGVRLHDMRHNFASAGIAAGLSLPEVGKLLGHRSVATTQRYAHLIEQYERQATARVAANITAAIKAPRLKVVK